MLPHEHSRGDLEVRFATQGAFGREERTGDVGGEDGGYGVREVWRVGPEVEAGGAAGVAFDGEEAGGGFDEVEGDLRIVNIRPSL